MFETVEKNELHSKLTELENLFEAKTKETGTTAEELISLTREHTKLLARFLRGLARSTRQRAC